MVESRRIGILLFLYTRDELSPAEQEELRLWRNQDPENEKLFFQMTDPDSLRLVMQEYYKERDRDFENLKKLMPELSEMSLSGSIDNARRKFSDVELLDDDQPDLSEDEYAGSGLSPVEYWNSMISRLGDAEQLEGETKVVPITRRTIKSRLRIKNRPLRYFAWAAAITIALVIINYFTEDKTYQNYKAEMISSDGIKSMIEDFNRGFEAGKAGVKIQTDKGEPIYFAANEREAKKDKTYSLHTAPGGEFVLQLPDETMIWMNAASRITYPANFDQDTIRIKVEGEVYIEMSKDTTHHFLISPSSVIRHPSSIHAQPSSNLNINTYPGNDEMFVTLIRGIADAKMNTSENKFHFLNGQQALIIDDSLTLIKDVNAEEVIAWKNGEFYYKNAGLPFILPALEKWYDVNIQYGSRIPDKKISLRLPRSAPLIEVLDNLRKQGIHITQRGKIITIWK
ncbi:MAG TPA: FecR domain-containing protein [Puia sp.]|nr:FecR domain-containing protein [Puia sp.]